MADYIAEVFHNELRPLNFTDVAETSFSLGKQVGQRDRRAILRTVSGLLKLIHPEGRAEKHELAEYLTFAAEMRRRVKEQLRRINPTESAQCGLSFIDRESGREEIVVCTESEGAADSNVPT